jgi:hypothetical protein
MCHGQCTTEQAPRSPDGPWHTGCTGSLQEVCMPTDPHSFDPLSSWWWEEQPSVPSRGLELALLFALTLGAMSLFVWLAVLPGPLESVPTVPADLHPVASEVASHPAVQACLAEHVARHPSDTRLPAMVEIRYDPVRFRGWKTVIHSRDRPLLDCLVPAVRATQPPRVGHGYAVLVPLRPAAGACSFATSRSASLPSQPAVVRATPARKSASHL